MIDEKEKEIENENEIRLNIDDDEYYIIKNTYPADFLGPAQPGSALRLVYPHRKSRPHA